MSGIPRYNNAPLNARSGVPVSPNNPPSGATLQTSQTASASSPFSSSPLTNRNPTTTSSPQPSYPQAQPAAAVPLPTGLTSSSPTSPRYVPAAVTEKPEPTRTIKEDSEVPPAPQPAAFPKPTTGFAGNGIPRTVPPPPRAGQAVSPMPRGPNAGQREVHMRDSAGREILEYPPQMSIPPPSITRAPFSSTMSLDARTAVSTSQAYMPSTMHPQPVSITDAYLASTRQQRQQDERLSEVAAAQRGDEQRDVQHLEHPPGYVQNAYAAELSSDQRRAMDVIEEKDVRERNGSLGLGMGMGMGVFGGGHGNAHAHGNVNGGGGDDEGEGIWGSAKRWVGSAGSKLSEGEKEVWRRINGE